MGRWDINPFPVYVTHSSSCRMLVDKSGNGSEPGPWISGPQTSLTTSTCGRLSRRWIRGGKVHSTFNYVSFMPIGEGMTEHVRRWHGRYFLKTKCFKTSLNVICIFWNTLWYYQPMWCWKRKKRLMNLTSWQWKLFKWKRKSKCWKKWIKFRVLRTTSCSLKCIIIVTEGEKAGHRWLIEIKK